MNNKSNNPVKKNPAHTPGPWVADASHVRTAINTFATPNLPVKHIALVNFCKYPDYEIGDREHQANANLIAAAPEMLEVLRWLDNEMDCRNKNDSGVIFFSRWDFERVRRVIKLAMEGRGC
jgi:hypothetical protein